MGMDISASLIVGFPYPVMEGICESKGLDIAELLDDGELEYASPWYDADQRYWNVGYSATCTFIDYEAMQKELKELVDEFINQFGISPSILVVPDVT